MLEKGQFDNSNQIKVLMPLLKNKKPITNQNTNTMKKLKILILAILISIGNLFAQSPQKFNYQAVARDVSGNLIANQSVNFRISILQATENGTAVYTEHHLKTTNNYGQVSMQIGSGTEVSGAFDSINWGNNIYFLKTEIDISAGFTFTYLGTTQLLSVPYALFAKSTGNVKQLTDADNDTKIQVEETTDDDVIRFDVLGNEKLKINNTGLVLPNTTSNNTGVIYKSNERFIHNYKPESNYGFNTFIGTNSGNFTMGDNNNFNGASYNTAVGHSTLPVNTTGQSNTAIGYTALNSNSTGNYNTATGFQALAYNTSGNSNTANGWKALYYNTTGSQNTAVGESSLMSNSSGFLNTAIGLGSLNFNTSGNYNSAIGTMALFSNTTGGSNVAMGSSALHYNSTGSENTALGHLALYNNIGNSRSTALGYLSMYYADNRSTGQWTFNTAIGYEALKGSVTASANTGRWNTAVGDQSLFSNKTGNYNTGCGNQALFSNTEGYCNTSNGCYALYFNTTGTSNSALGYKALYNTTEGHANTAVGRNALNNNDTGDNNVAVGYQSLSYNYSGYNNVAFGFSAGNANTIGINNTFIGTYADAAGSSFNNSTAIGYNATVDGSNKVRIGNSSVISIGGQVGWSNYSDRRLKTNIKPSMLGLNFIMKLEPVSYNFNNEGQQGVEYTGFIAQDVEEILNQLNISFSGLDKPANTDSYYALRYAEFTVPLVKAIQEQQVQIESQKASIEKLQNIIEVLSQRMEKLEGDK